MVYEDDSFGHARVYDPVKAREYYLRTRQLKGRQPGAEKPLSSMRPRLSAAEIRTRQRLAKRKKLEAEKERLKSRIEELRNAIELLVRAAKRRAGVDPNETPKEKADRNTRDKKNEPLTEKQKREKRKEYAKEKKKDPSLSQEVEALRSQIASLKEKLKSAIAEAERQQKTKPVDTQSRSSTQLAQPKTERPLRRITKGARQNGS